MAARDAVKRVPEIARNHCPSSAKCAIGPRMLRKITQKMILEVLRAVARCGTSACLIHRQGGRKTSTLS